MYYVTSFKPHLPAFYCLILKYELTILKKEHLSVFAGWLQMYTIFHPNVAVTSTR